jgi:MFS transporter, MHS family, citrate/tricarballylate:H+ symporter
MIGAIQTTAAASGPTTLHWRHVVAATVGNALEFYDFITYAFFAIQIGHAFFPSHDPYASLMLSLATFGAGFITRPIGGIVIGAYADRVGRRPAMMLSFSLMGAAIIAIALIPPYAKIGLAAPVLAVLARMVQGFSLGGEVGPTTAFLMEASPPSRRGLAVSWQGASQGIAATAAGLVGAGLAQALPPAALDAWGWRVAFLLGAVTLPFGLWMRRGMAETLHAPEPDGAGSGAAAPTRLSLVGRSRRIIILALLALSAGTIGTYVLDYMTTYAQTALRLPPSVGLWGNGLGSLAGVASVLAGGWLSDRLGRRPVMIWANLAFVTLVLPLFLWIVRSHSAVVFVLANLALGALANCASGAFYAAVVESLPKRIRGGAFATVYALAIAVCGGSTQLVVTWLIRATGDPMAPAWYLFAATLVGQGALWLMLESAPARMPTAAPAVVPA